MNENVCINIQPVANGFIVQLPFEYPNQWDGLKQIMPQHDPMLETKKNTELMKKTEHVHVFETFEQVLAFLSNKYIVK